MKNKIILSSAIIASLPQLALAHVGDHSQTSFSHLFTHPYHIAAILGLVAVGGYFLNRRAKEKIVSKESELRK